MAVRIGSVRTPELAAIAGGLRSQLALGQVRDVSLHDYPTHYALCSALLDGEIDVALGYLQQLASTVGGQSTSDDAMVEQLATRSADYGLAIAGMSRAQVGPVLVMLRDRAAQLQISSVADLAGQAASLKLGGPFPIEDQLWARLGFTSKSRAKFADLVPLGPGGEFARTAIDQAMVDVAVSWTTEPAFAGPGYARFAGSATAADERLVALVRTEARGSVGASATGAFLQKLTAGQTAELVRGTSGN